MNNITVIEKQFNYLEDVVYNGLNPSGISVGGGGGSESDLYYSKVQLDAGQLDNRYYIKAEVNTWRNDVTQTEMGYLHGATPITSNVQAQLTARAIISGTPAQYQTAVWTGTTSILGDDALCIGFNNEIWTDQGVDGNAILYINHRGYEAGQTQYRDTQISDGKGGLIAYFDGSTGYVGIGVTLPISNLHIEQASIPVLTLRSSTGTDSANTGSINFVTDVSARGSQISGYREVSSNKHALIFSTFYTTLQERMRIDSKGNVGINTAAPHEKLDINGNLAVHNEINFSPLVEGNAIGYINYEGYLSGITQYRDLQIGDGRHNIILTIDGSAGNVGIRTSSPDKHLHISDNIGATIRLESSENAISDTQEFGVIEWETKDASAPGVAGRIVGVAEGIYGRLGLSFETGYVGAGLLERVRIDNLGNVGIGDTTPTYKLDVNGTGRFTGNLFLDAYIGTTNYQSEQTGWRGTYAGAFDFRSVYTDELIAKTFIADIDLALLSGTMVSKSITQVSRNFTVPAVDSTATLYVEAIPGFPTSKTFESGDWIRLQVINRTGGGLRWLKVYGTVDAGTLVDGGATGEQYYTFTTKYCGAGGAAEDETVYAGAGAQDLGVSGNGFIQSEAGSYSLNTPYIQTATWTTNPYEGENIEVRTRMGNLAGIPNQTGFGLTTRRDNTNYVTQWWTAADDWGIRGVVGGNEVFKLGDENKIACLTIESTKLYIGTGTYGDPNTDFYVDNAGQFSLQDKLTWDGTDLSITGAIKATTGEIGSGADLWTITADSIYTGTEHLTDDWNTAMDGITLATDGAIHAPNFYVNTGGEIGLRQVESILFKVDGSQGLKIKGSEIWEDQFDNDSASISINLSGYDYGSSRFRDFYVYDGKAATMLHIDGSEATIDVYGDFTVNANLDVTGSTTSGDLDVTGEIRSTEVKKWSCSGANFKAVNPDTNDIAYAYNYGTVTASADGIYLLAPVSLPNGAVISSAEVFGNAGAAAETWRLYRVALSNGASGILGTAVINTEDTSISNATVDNDTYGYFFSALSLDTSDAIYGANITYVL